MKDICGRNAAASPFQGSLLLSFHTQGSSARFACSSTLGFAAPRFQRSWLDESYPATIRFFYSSQIAAVRATQTPKHQVPFSPSAPSPRFQVDVSLSAHAPKGQVDSSPSDQAPKGRSSKAQGVNPGISRNNLKALKGRRSRSSRPDGFLRGGRARCSASGSGRYRSGSGPRRSLSEKRRASAEKCKARTPAVPPDARTRRRWNG